MKTLPLIGSIVLFLAAGVALAFGANSLRMMAITQERARTTMAEIQNVTDMAQLEGWRTFMNEQALFAAEKKNEAMASFGGAVALLAGSGYLFLRSRRPRSAPRASQAALG